MKTIARYEELSLSPTGRQLSTTATEKAIANISLASGKPLVSSWFDPDPKFLRGSSWRDRAERKTFSSNNELATQTNAINGRPTLTLPGSTYFTEDSESGVFNADAWSFAGVFQFTGAASARVLIGTTPDAGSGSSTYSPIISFSTTGLSPGINLGVRVIRGDTAARVADGANEYLNVPVCLVAAFSTSRGLTLRRNGVEVSRAPAATQPLTDNKFQLFGNKVATNRFPGDVGRILICDDDITLPENASALSQIETYLMDWYGIL